MSPKVLCITTVDMSLKFLVLDSLTYLRARGYEMVGVAAAGQYVAEVEQAGIRVIVVPMTRRITPCRDLLALLSLVQILSRERPSIVHTHTPKANLLGQWAAWLTGCPHRVSTVHGFYFTPETPFIKRTLFRFIEWMSALPPHIVFLINQQDMDTALQLRVIARAKLRLLKGGLGIDLSRFDGRRAADDRAILIRQGLGLPANALVIGYVGRLVREKGLLDLFAAFGRVMAEEPDAYLLLVGPFDAAKPDAVSPQVADDYGISSHTVFTGLRLDTPDIYRIMDIFVLPSYREGLPLSAMEAQAMALPVITTDARGCREVIEPGKTGFLVPPGSPSALSDSLLALLEDPDLRFRMGAAGRELAMKRFDQRLAFAAFEEAYMDLLTSVRSRSKDTGIP